MAVLFALQEWPNPGPIPFWWLWLLIAVMFLGIIIYLVSHIGPGGPWMRR